MDSGRDPAQQCAESDHDDAGRDRRAPSSAHEPIRCGFEHDGKQRRERDGNHDLGNQSEHDDSDRDGEHDADERPGGEPDLTGSATSNRSAARRFAAAVSFAVRSDSAAGIGLLAPIQPHRLLPDGRHARSTLERHAVRYEMPKRTPVVACPPEALVPTRHGASIARREGPNEVLPRTFGSVCLRLASPS